MLQYEPARVQWVMKLTPYAMPSGGGLIRTFTTVDVSADECSILAGTTAGEMMVFRIDSGVFRACIPICTNGVQSLAALPDGGVVLGGGDGSVKRLEGSDMAWHMALETTVDSGVKSISLSTNSRELIIACSSGSVLRCLADTLVSSTVGVGHTSAVTCIAFSKEGGSIFATGTKSGDLRVWDVSDYACLAMTSYPKSGAVLTVCLIDKNNVISGWEDGFVRCHDSATLNRLVWYIPCAHRGGTRSISAHFDQSLQYFVSGGGDGAVRVWRLANRELVTQYTEHTKGVSKVMVDVKSSNIVHSVGIDCSVLSYDLRAAKRIICHIVTSGAMTDMTQRRDSENELVTCDSQGQLLHWDIDARDPVVAVQDPGRGVCVSL